MNTRPLITYFEKLLPLDGEEKAFLDRVFRERVIKRRQYILQQGEVCKWNTFVVEGCFRMYFVDDNGKEHNLQFAVENWWIGDISSFHSEEPSRLNIEAIENAVILQIKKEDQLRLFVEFPKFNRIFRVFTENALVSYQNRVLQNISTSAEERYLDFVRRYPDFFNRISNVQIASFLGVTPEFLSAIRKRLAKT
ncbi:MAG: cyclic nucleotide-binding domain-containing protein [Cryomorphaceae bacterium]|nr:cyclic nucleotide-binding domain-containing protein [Cryomorphaceae bacterium]